MPYCLAEKPFFRKNMVTALGIGKLIVIEIHEGNWKKDM
jgi:hypothetical protein